MPIHEMERLAGLYLSELMQDFLRRPAQRDGGARPHCPTPEPVIDILCSKAFTHLSQTRSMPYRARIAHSLQADLAGQRPLRFFYDLGPGYHAALELNNGDLRFTPGLGELLALWQILRFARCVERVYPAGVRFGLVIDDLCAWVANDVALDSTWTYLRRLEALIRSVGLDDLVGVLAESALIDKDDYRRTFAGIAPMHDTIACGASERENVSRFVGRACTDEAVLDHLERYQRGQMASAQWMAAHLDGVRLTQRASEQCLGFRAFPGGSARIQSGEIDLLVSAGSRPRPQLVTSRSQGQYRRWPLPAAHLPEHWPLAGNVVHVAVKLASDG